MWQATAGSSTFLPQVLPFPEELGDSKCAHRDQKPCQGPWPRAKASPMPQG